MEVLAVGFLKYCLNTPSGYWH